MTFGFTPSGFVPKLVADIENDIDVAMRATVDPNMDLSAAQPLGQMKSAVATEGALLWEVAATCASGINPDNAEGMVLDGVCAFTGTKRAKPVYSTVIASMTLNATVTVPFGSSASVSGQPTNTWTLRGLGDPATGLQVGDLGPVVSTTSGTYYGLFQATTPGPTHVNAGQLTVISTPVSGWTAVTNVAAEVTGALVESDALLQVRREGELSASGGSTTDACRADLLQVLDSQNIIGQAFVFENTGDVTDSNGVPPHSMHALVFDGLAPNTTIMNPLIAAAVWRNKPTGGGTVGSITVLTPDSTGTLRPVSFDRATINRVAQAITVKTDSTFDVTNGPLAVKNALVSYWATVQQLNVGMNRNLGDVLLLNKLYAVKGVTDVTAFTLGVYPTSSGVINLPASLTGIYTLAASDIGVTVT